MSYDIKFREKIIEYRELGHTLEEITSVFNIATSTIRKWEKIKEETRELKDKVPKMSYKKIEPEKLKKYIKTHLDAYQLEIAKVFSCVQSGVNKARKKRQSGVENKSLKK